MKQSNSNAVSPVIGVMLMLVVTIIIAAVVAAFAGGSMGSTSKTPQATIKAVFSQSGGMQIIHAGGDAIPSANTLFTMTNDATFGQGLGSSTSNVIDKSLITDENGNQLLNPDGTSNVTTFGPGQSLYVSRDNLNCYKLQPIIGVGGANNYNINNGQAWKYTGDQNKLTMWALCYTNPDNVGKTFTLLMSDKASGAVMGRTTVVIAP